MEEVIEDLKNIYIPKDNSHKGQNGKLLIVGGSHLFHAASLWSLTIASRIVDMVFFSSVDENNQITIDLKKEFRNGMVIPRSEIDHYAKEADCILIGPGMMRTESQPLTLNRQPLTLNDINQLTDEGEQTFYLTKYLLEHYPTKRFVIDAGALQMLNPDFLLNLSKMPILTPHKGEFERLLRNHELGKKVGVTSVEGYPDSAQENGMSEHWREGNTWQNPDMVKAFAKKYNCIILLKGEKDLVASPTKEVEIPGGNAGMTKGGTGDVLAGLTAALYAQNENPFLAAVSSSFFNKKAGEELFKSVGYYFNSTDLANEIPKVMKKYLLKK